MNQLPTDKLELSIVLFKKTHNQEINSGQLSGQVGADVDFELLCSSLDAAELLISKNYSDKSLECHLSPNFFESIDKLISAKRIKAPPRFYLADIDILHTNGETISHPIIRDYLAATKLYSMLAQIADHQVGTGSDNTLIFLHKEKIEIIPKYSATDLQELSNLVFFESEFITSETHKEQKKTIIKTVLFELFSGKNKVLLSELLSRFNEFTEKVRVGYQLYVAEFSFQKVKNEVEKEKLDAIVKLNKVFSDIQNQLLAIPIALVLVGGQMENKNEWASKNIIIWLGALIFSILMDLLIHNQRNTLIAVKNEVDQQRQQIESKYQSVASRFKQVYEEIDKRHTHQKRLIFVIDVLVACCLAISTFFLFYFSGVFLLPF